MRLKKIIILAVHDWRKSSETLSWAGVKLHTVTLRMPYILFYISQMEPDLAEVLNLKSCLPKST